MVPLFAALLSLPLPARYPPLTLTPQRQRQKTLEALLTWLWQETDKHPVLFIVEDLHWVDPSTLEFLNLLVDQSPTARIMVLLDLPPGISAALGESRPSHAAYPHASPQPQVERMVASVAGGEGLTARGDPAARGENRWGAVVCRRADQDGAGIGPAPGT